MFDSDANFEKWNFWARKLEKNLKKFEIIWTVRSACLRLSAFWYILHKRGKPKVLMQNMHHRWPSWISYRELLLTCIYCFYYIFTFDDKCLSQSLRTITNIIESSVYLSSLFRYRYRVRFLRDDSMLCLNDNSICAFY